MHNKHSVAAIVVTYNRKVLLKECLDSLLGQTVLVDAIVIVDNASTDGTAEFLRELGYLENPIIDYLLLPTNTGGAGGFHDGMKRGYDRGFDWLWLMDDDVIVLKDTFGKLLKYIKKFSDSMTVLLCDIIDSDEHLSKTEEIEDIIYEVDERYGNFVGYAIPCQIISKIGLPRKDFFIYYDDIEYSYRIIKNNGKLIKVKNSKVVHRDWQHMNNKEVIEFFGKKYSYPNNPKWKIYYLIRNNIILNREYGILNYIGSVKGHIRFLLRTILLKPSNAVVVGRAIIHGLFGVAGGRMKP